MAKGGEDGEQRTGLQIDKDIKTIIICFNVFSINSTQL